MSARTLRSSTGFPRDEIFVQRAAIAGPNNTVVTSDISLDLVDDRVIRILGTEIFSDSLVIGAGSQIIAGVSLNPDKTTYAENLTDLGDDDIIHHVRWENIFTTSGSTFFKLSDYRRYPEQGITYGQQRLRCMFFSAQNLSGGFFGHAVYYKFDTITQEQALAILRRR